MIVLGRVDKYANVYTTVPAMASGKKLVEMSEDSLRGIPDPSSLELLLRYFSIAVLILLFAKLSSEVVEGDTRSFDVYLLRHAQSMRLAYPSIASVMRDLTGLGSTAVLTLFAGVTVVYLALLGSMQVAITVTCAVSTGTIVVDLLKTAFGRLRPDAGFAEVAAQGLSFPSGHASNSAIVYLTLGALVACTRTHLSERTYIRAVAAVMTGAVGVSRVALGVHWATDVIAGWAFGAAWALLWLAVARRFIAPSFAP